VIQGVSSRRPTRFLPGDVDASSSSQRREFLQESRRGESVFVIGIDGTNTTMKTGRIQDQPQTSGNARTSATDCDSPFQPALRAGAGITLYMQR